MRHRHLFRTAAVSATLLTAGCVGQSSSETVNQVGDANFPISCEAAVQEDFNRAIAMLHSFWYQASEGLFAEIAERDPDCAMAHWGIAMSRFHQLWGQPTPDDLQVALHALDNADRIGAGTPRERDYIQALRVYYDGADQVDHLQRIEAYERAMDKLHRSYPEDSEAAIFYSLSLLATAYASPPDKDFSRQKKAGSQLESLFAAQPDHPGLAHYIIHSYDYPPLADKALQAARQYATIAPDAPHALHMPSHIFTRLGFWQESIASNDAAADSARRSNWTGEEIHASDYLTYAYLQRGADEKALELLKELSSQKTRLERGEPNYTAGVFGAAAIPARYWVERRQWEEATRLPIDADFFPGGPLCWAESTLHLARGLGAARSGQTDKARQSGEQLQACLDLLKEANSALWASRVDVQRRAVAAWLRFAEGDQIGAVELMRAAADLEDGTDKPPITPGAIVPARELLGEMLLEANQPAAALVDFETSLRDSPNRFWSLYGAARAARQAGHSDVAGTYYSKLLQLTDGTDTQRAQVQEAEEFLSSQ